jgi:hypothetical protein
LLGNDWVDEVYQSLGSAQRMEESFYSTEGTSNNLRKLLNLKEVISKTNMLLSTP